MAKPNPRLLQMEPTVPCQTCGGAGHVPLIPSLREALDAVDAEPISPVGLADKLDLPNVTAANNRLERLRALGLVRRERFGRGYVYMRADARGR